MQKKKIKNKTSTGKWRELRNRNKKKENTENNRQFACDEVMIKQRIKAETYRNRCLLFEINLKPIIQSKYTQIMSCMKNNR